MRDMSRKGNQSLDDRPWLGWLAIGGGGSDSPVHTWSAAEELVLRSITETFYPSLEAQESDRIVKAYEARLQHTDVASVRRYFQDSPAWDPDLPDFLFTKLKRLCTQPKFTLIRWLLSTLFVSWWGMALLTLGACWRPFHQLNLQERERVLFKLLRSPLQDLRILVRALHAVINMYYFGHVNSALLQHWVHERSLAEAFQLNARWPVLGYPGPPVPNHCETGATVLDLAVLSVSNILLDTRSETGERATPSPTPIADKSVVDVKGFDVVVIGSGAGGGVAAARLAAGGVRVLVCEKGPFRRTHDLSLVEEETFETMFDRGAAMASKEGSMLIFAGSTLGGGTTINWSASLQTPFHVREEWENRFKLPYFNSPAFQVNQDYVCSRMGVETASISHNASNQVILDGCKRLCMPVTAVPQNTGHQAHACGFCSLGCPTATKQGTKETFLKDAAGNGTKILCSVHVDSILREGGRVVGVLARSKQFPGRVLRIHATFVVVSCGAIQSPALLLRSGFRNQQIGKNLRLHPTVGVVGVIPGTKSWQGSILTTLATPTDHSPSDGSHYGSKIEVPTLHPMLSSAILPFAPVPSCMESEMKQWTRPLTVLKRLTMAKFCDFSPVIVIQRDRDSVGMVGLTDEGEPEISFRLSSHDAESLTEGLVRALDILTAAGAAKLHTSLETHPLFMFFAKEESKVSTVRSPDHSHAGFRAFREGIRRTKIQPGMNTSILSAHQMGSCRLAADPSQGPCRPNGQLWECDEVWVCDGSLLPTSSGVNPMITIMAVADYVSRECLAWYTDTKRS